MHIYCLILSSQQLIHKGFSALCICSVYTITLSRLNGQVQGYSRQWRSRTEATSAAPSTALFLVLYFPAVAVWTVRAAGLSHSYSFSLLCRDKERDFEVLESGFGDAKVESKLSLGWKL